MKRLGYLAAVKQLRQLVQLAIGIAIALVAMPALAQQKTSPPPVDPRIASEMVQALQSIAALREAMIKAMAEDAQRREAEWAEYSKPLWQIPEPAK